MLRRLAGLKSIDVAVTIVTYEEQTRGWFQLVARARTEAEEVATYGRLEQHLKLFSRLPIVGYDEAAAATFRQLRGDYRRLGRMDLKIAAIAISQDAVLLTRNLSDFGQIAGLKCEDWS